MKTKHISGFEGLYLIDIYGNILSIKSNKYLKPNLSDDYPRIKLSKDNKDYNRAIHRLVIETFSKNLDNKPIINHIDGNKSNYSLSNLEYVSYSENSNHALKNNLKTIKYGISSKLCEKDVVDILKSFDTYKVLSEKYNVNISTINNIKNGRTWKKLDKKMDYNKLSIIKNIGSIEEFDYTNYKQIENHPNYKIDTNGNIINLKNKVMKVSLTKGYLRIFLNKKNYFIHRLVAITFLFNKDLTKNMVNHKDGNPLNNKLDNLEWCDSAYNTQHAVDNKLFPIQKGELVGTSKLKNDDVLNIFNSNKKYTDIMKEFNVSIGTISLIKNKKIWKHILN